MSFENLALRTLLLVAAAIAPIRSRAADLRPVQAATTSPFAIADINIVDVRSGRILPRRTVIIHGNRITAILHAGQRPGPQVKIIPGAGQYILPGLWDMHVHIAHPGYFDHFVANGIVGVRDMGGNRDGPSDGCESVKASLLQRWRSEIRAATRVGPDVVISGPAISGTGGPGGIAVHTADDARSAVATLKGQAVDFIKVYDGLTLPAYRALAAAANQTKLDFAGHVPEDVGPLLAIQLGQRSVEHVRDAMLVCFTDDPAALEMFFRRDRWSAADRNWGHQASRNCDPIIAELTRRKSWFTPTLVVEKAKVNVEDASFRDDPRRASMPASVRAGFEQYHQRKLAQSPADRASERLWWTTQQRLVRRLAKADIAFLAGTDSACQGGLPGYSLHDELDELVAAGLSPAQSLRAATLEPARYLRRLDEGEVARGYKANLLVLDANPLTNIGNSRRIRAVILDGVMIERPELDRLQRQ